MAARAIREEEVEIGGLRTFARVREGDGTPVILFHGNPCDSSDWVPFLERIEGPAIAADMPAFGRSERPSPDRFDCSLEAYGAWAEELIDHYGGERYRLAVHDWGSVGLLGAMARPERVERLLAFNCVPFGVEYRWHWLAHYIWRRRGVGELFNRLTTRSAAAALLRQARPGFEPMPEEWFDAWWPHFDAATRAAVLALYRSADGPALERAGERLGELDCPALVLWPQQDRFLPALYGRRLGHRLPRAELEEIEGAGHWPWIDRPELIGRAAEFLRA